VCDDAGARRGDGAARSGWSCMLGMQLRVWQLTSPRAACRKPGPVCSTRQAHNEVRGRMGCAQPYFNAEGMRRRSAVHRRHPGSESSGCAMEQRAQSQGRFAPASAHETQQQRHGTQRCRLPPPQPAPLRLRCAHRRRPCRCRRIRSDPLTPMKL